MEDQDKIISLQDAKAKAAGISPELAQVITQLNQRFGIRIDLSDERLNRFKMLYPALNEAATQQHDIALKGVPEAYQKAFLQGVELGKGQMMIDVIICILEQDGLLERKQ